MWNHLLIFRFKALMAGLAGFAPARTPFSGMLPNLAEPNGYFCSSSLKHFCFLILFHS